MTTPSRRSFLKAAAVSTAAWSSGSLAALRATVPVHSGGRATLKFGLVGCGGRGSGAAVQALRAHPENVLWALGDAFADRLEGSLAGIGEAMAETTGQAQVQVARERCFTGLDCIDRVLDSGIDVVLLASPPGFRPMQIEKAVAKGVHIFAEKPVATDAPGLRAVRAACAVAKQKGLNVVSGLCYRYHDGRRALIERLQQGAVGEILAIQGNYVTGELWSFPRKEGWSDLEWQLRNWLYHTWLSGDLIAEQHIHTLDMMAWIKRDVYPQKCWSTGGRQKRTAAEYGNVYDHFATVYEWADGTRGFSYCRQQNGCFRDVNEYVLGTQGQAEVFAHRITGKAEWRFGGTARDMYQVEHDEMSDALRGGKRIDDADTMCNSTLMAIMGRMAAYTGQQITWQQAWDSEESLLPQQLDWNAPLPVAAVAIPGRTKFR